MKRIATALVLSLTLPHAAAAGPGAKNLQVSGGNTLLIIDADGDGPDADDCRLTATFTDPVITFQWTQSNTPLIRGCSGTNPGWMFVGQDSSSDFIEISSDPAAGANGTVPPLLVPISFTVDSYEEFFSGSPDGFPASLNTADIDSETGGTLLSAFLCEAGGVPTGQVSGPLLSSDGPIQFHPSAGAPTHIAALAVPFQLAPSEGSGVVSLDLFVPMTGNRVTFGVEGESPLLVDIDFDDLSMCRSRAAAPAVSSAGLAATAVGLFAIGWRMRRRRLDPSRA